MRRLCTALALACTVLAVSCTGPAFAQSSAGYPPNAVPINAASPNSPNTTISLSLGGTANWITSISGFKCAGGGATAVVAQALTIASVAGDGNGSAAQLIYPVVVPAGATVPWEISDKFIPPLPANSPGATITFILPALGTGNLYAYCQATGFRAPRPQ